MGYTKGAKVMAILEWSATTESKPKYILQKLDLLGRQNMEGGLLQQMGCSHHSD